MHFSPPTRPARRPLLALALPALLLLLGLVGLRPPPAALASCLDTGTGVADTSELNAAINAYNNFNGTCHFKIYLENDITLTANLLSIDNVHDSDALPLTIDGAGFVLDGGAQYEMFGILDADVTLKNITITGGKDDGIYVYQSTLRVENSHIHTNDHSGIFAVMTDLQVVNSAVTNNEESGIVTDYDSVATYLINTTIAENGEQGVSLNGGNNQLTHVTIIDNDYIGLWAPQGTTVANSILTGNGTADCRAKGTSVPDVTHSLLGVNDPVFSCALADTTITGQAPQLRPLGDHGGRTPTAPPAAGSPAINAGNNDLSLDESNAPLSVDQRGYPRRLEGAVDLGAAESGCELAMTAADEDQLNAAIQCFNATDEPGDYTITLTTDIDLTRNLDQINNFDNDVTLMIDGAGFTVDGRQTNHIFYIFASDVTLNNLSVTGSSDDAIYINNSELRLVDTHLHHNAGEGIRASNTNIHMADSAIVHSGSNGIIASANSGRTIHIINSTIAENGNWGLNIPNGTLRLTHVTLIDNANTGLATAATAYINNSVLAGNGSSDCFRVGAVQQFSHSLVQVDDPTYPCGAAADSSNITGQDPQLLPLGNHGGRTPTAPPVLGSPVVDQGDNNLAKDENGDDLTTDQRGAARRVGARVDMGAAELSTAFYMSAATSGNAPGVGNYNNADILKWDGSTWSKFFDAEAAGLAPNNKSKHNVNAFWIGQDEIVMAFAQNSRKVPGVTPKADGNDLVRWNENDGFSFWFDGSDVGLTKKGPEKIDGLHVLPGDAAPALFDGVTCHYYLLISTIGPGDVTGIDGKRLKFGGEDVLGFCMTSAGEATAGLWHMVLDGSAEYVKKNAIDSISLSADGQTLYVTTKANFAVDAAIGGHSSVYTYDLATELGGGDGAFSGPLFRAGSNGLTKKVDGLQMD